MKTYRNGVRTDNTTATAGSYTGMSNTSQELTIGSYGAGLAAFSGSMDDVRIYRRELTQAEVGQIYSSGRQ